MGRVGVGWAFVGVGWAFAFACAPWVFVAIGTELWTGVAPDVGNVVKVGGPLAVGPEFPHPATNPRTRKRAEAPIAMRASICPRSPPPLRRGLLAPGDRAESRRRPRPVLVVILKGPNRMRILIPPSSLPRGCPAITDRANADQVTWLKVFSEVVLGTGGLRCPVRKAAGRGCIAHFFDSTARPDQGDSRCVLSPLFGGRTDSAERRQSTAVLQYPAELLTTRGARPGRS